MKTQFCSFLWVIAVAGMAVVSAQEPTWSGHWTFAGTLADQSGRGGLVYMAKPEYAAGVSDQALRFAANTATIMDAPELRLAPGFRLACRVRLEKLPEGNSWSTLAIKGSLTRGEYYLRVDPANEGQHFAFFIECKDTAGGNTIISYGCFSM